MSGPLKYDYSKLKGDPAEAPGLSSYIVGLGYATTAYVDDEVSANGASLQAFASNASNLSSGTVSDARLSANVPRLNAASNAFSGAVTVPRISSPTSELPIFQSGADRANFSNGALTVTTFVGICASNPGAPDVFVRRNATGPTLETRAAGGLKVCNADGSALAALACGDMSIGASGLVVGNESNYLALYTSTAKNAYNSLLCNFVQTAAAGVVLRRSGGFVMRNNSDGKLSYTNWNATGGAVLDFNTADTLTIRNQADSAAGNLVAGTITGSSVSVGAGLSAFYEVGSANLVIRAGSGGGSKILNYRGSTNTLMAASDFVLGVVSGVDSTSGSSVCSLSRASDGVWQMGTNGANANGSLNLANLTVGTGGRVTFTNGAGSPSIGDYSNAGITVYAHNGGLGTTRAQNSIVASIGYFYVESRGLMTSSANGNIHIQNYDFNESVDQALVLGPGTSASNGVRFKRAVGTTTAQLRNGNDSADASLNLANLTASGGITFGPRTKSALLATSATATAGVWRITDSTPAQRLAYPDGTNWRYMSDDTVVT